MSCVAAVYIASFSVRLLSGSHLKLCVHAFFSSLEGLWGCLIVRQCLCPLLSCCSKSLFSKSHFFFLKIHFLRRKENQEQIESVCFFFFFLFILPFWRRSVHHYSKTVPLLVILVVLLAKHSLNRDGRMWYTICRMRSMSRLSWLS